MIVAAETRGTRSAFASLNDNPTIGSADSAACVELWFRPLELQFSRAGGPVPEPPSPPANHWAASGGRLPSTVPLSSTSRCMKYWGLGALAERARGSKYGRSSTTVMPPVGSPWHGPGAAHGATRAALRSSRKLRSAGTWVALERPLGRVERATREGASYERGLHIHRSTNAGPGWLAFNEAHSARERCAPHRYLSRN